MRERVRVLAIGPAPLGPHSRGGMASVMTAFDERGGTDPAVEIRVVPTYVDDPRWQWVWVGVTGVLRAIALLLVGRADVLHVHLAHGGSVVRKALPLAVARARGVATVVHAHSYDFAGWFDTLGPAMQRFVRWAVRADRWIVLGEASVEPFAARLRLPTDRFTVLYNPVTVPAVDGPLSAPDDVVTALSLGRLGERKGSYDLVEAVASLPDAVRERLRVVLAGDGEVEEVRQLVAERGVSDQVSLAGWLDPDGRAAAIDAAQVFVLPSYHEGLPMALLEAMASGLAPVVTPVGGIPQVIDDDVTGLLVEPGDVPALAAALARLVDDPDTLARLRTEALARSGDFGIDRWFTALDELWADVVSARRR